MGRIDILAWYRSLFNSFSIIYFNLKRIKQERLSPYSLTAIVLQNWSIMNFTNIKEYT